jgi:ADP-heptose:LPS heptosyltransferase
MDSIPGHTKPSFLIIRRDNIGDLVCTTPLIRALRQHYPRARICALVNSYNAPVLENNPDLDHVYAYTKLKHRSKAVSAWRVLWKRIVLMASLRRQRFDYAIIAGARFLPRGLRLARMVRPRHIVGFTEQGRGGSRAIDMAVPYELPRPMHEVEDVFRLLMPLGIDGTPPPLRIVPNADALVAARSALRERTGWTDKTLIGVHIGAREAENRWPVENFIALIRELSGTPELAFALFWSPGDNTNPFYPGDDAAARAALDALPQVQIAAFPTVTIHELIAGLAVCDAVVCCDSGSLHLAAALGRPVLGFYCHVKTSRWSPWGVPHVVLAADQVREIGVAEAAAGLRRLLAKAGLARVPVSN